MALVNHPVKPLVNSSRVELFINITGNLYNPKGFLNDEKYASTLGDLSNEEKSEVLNGFVKYLAVTIRKMLKSSIHEQYYRSYWKPLNPIYARFKSAHGLSSNIWQCTGKLVSSITYRKQGNQYIVGIDPEVRYESGERVLTVAKWMEFGTKNMPARPLFTPVMNYVRKNIRLYWELFLQNPQKYVTQKTINKMKRRRR